MKNLYQTIPIAVLVAIVLVIPAYCRASEEIPPPAPQELYDKSSHVFAGTVAERISIPDPLPKIGWAIIIHVDHVWKGEITEKTIVLTRSMNRTGERYLFYANTSNSGIPHLQTTGIRLDSTLSGVVIREKELLEDLNARGTGRNTNITTAYPDPATSATYCTDDVSFRECQEGGGLIAFTEDGDKCIQEGFVFVVRDTHDYYTQGCHAREHTYSINSEECAHIDTFPDRSNRSRCVLTDADNAVPAPRPEVPIEEPRPTPELIVEKPLVPDHQPYITSFDFFKILFSPTRTFRVLTFIISRLFESSTNTTIPNEESHPSPSIPIDSPPIPKQTPIAPPEPLQNKFETIAHHDTAWYDLSHGDYVIQYAERWEEFWNQVHKARSPVPNLPSINFDATMVLATVMGTRPTGGFAIEITDVLEKEHSIEIIIQETVPDPNSIQTQAATNPYHIIAIDRTEKEIVFVR